MLSSHSALQQCPACHGHVKVIWDVIQTLLFQVISQYINQVVGSLGRVELVSPSYLQYMNVNTDLQSSQCSQTLLSHGLEEHKMYIVYRQ